MGAFLTVRVYLQYKYVLAEANEKILLCKRAIEPAYGAWTPPAGFLELGESSVEGAARETWEEAKANVEIIQPFVSIDLPRIGQIHVKYLARMKEPHFEPGPESLEVEPPFGEFLWGFPTQLEGSPASTNPSEHTYNLKSCQPLPFAIFT